MNWTGGRLQRHSKTTAKTTHLARQRQHFASVRQRLQNGETLQGTPFRPSFLVREDLTLANAITPFGQASQRHTGHSRGNQTSLEDYSSTAPVPQPLSSMQKPPVTSSDQATRQQKLPPSHRCRSGETDRPKLKYEAASGDEPSLRTREDSASTSSQHSASRKRARSRLGEENVLQLSRKKLLLQADWIGLAHARPVQMSFTSCQDKIMIGKRRRLDSGIKQRQRIFNRMKQVNHEYTQSGTLGVAPESISVRIGEHALSTQVSVAPPDNPVRPRQEVEQTRQSSESMLFDVEQRELSQPQGFGLTEERVEQNSRPRIVMNHTQKHDASAVCISDDTDTSGDNQSALDGNTRELESTNEAADAAIEEDLGVQQLLDRLNGQDNGDDQHDDDQGYSPIPPVQDFLPPPSAFRLVFESSSNHNSLLPSQSLLEQLSSRDKHGGFADHAERNGLDWNNSPSDIGEANPITPNCVNLYTAQARQLHLQEIDEVGPSQADFQDGDAPWRKLFSIPSSNAVDELDADILNVSSGHARFHSINTSLATTRGTELKTLRPAQRRLEPTSSASSYHSPSASFRMITSLVAQPPRVSQAFFFVLGSFSIYELFNLWAFPSVNFSNHELFDESWCRLDMLTDSFAIGNKHN